MSGCLGQDGHRPPSASGRKGAFNPLSESSFAFKSDKTANLKIK